MTRTIVRSLILLSAAIVPFAGGIAACSKEEPPPQRVVRKTVPKEQAKAAEAKPPDAQAAKSAAAVFYDPAGKRDPFVPFLRVEPKSARAMLENVSPLQRYELGELKFVGMIWGAKGAHALVEDGEGKGYTVTVGTKIGRGGGVVTRITDGEILVKEEFRDYTGMKVVRESSMKLQSAGGR